MIYYGMDYLYAIHRIYLICGTISFIYAAIWVTKRKRYLADALVALAPTSFFIYAIHRIGVTAVSKQILFFFFFSVWGQTFKFLVCPVITVFICVALYWGLKQFAPRLLRILCGR